MGVSFSHVRGGVAESCAQTGRGGAESCAQTAEEIKNYWNACLRGEGHKFVVIHVLTAPFCRPLPMSNDVEMTSY